MCNVATYEGLCIMLQHMKAYTYNGTLIVKQADDKASLHSA